MVPQSREQSLSLDKCINAVENRAMRFFLCTGKYTLTAAVSWGMGWTSAFVKQWKCSCNHWNRMLHMDDGRKNIQVVLWADQMASRNCRNYNFVIKDTLRQIGLAQFADTNYAINLRTFSIDVH